MGRTHRDQVLDYLRSISPEMATNGQIRENTSISSHQQVYMLTQELRRNRLIQGERRGREWVFWVAEPSEVPPVSQPPTPVPNAPAGTHGVLTPREFETMARSVLSIRLGALLTVGEVPGVPKHFDFVSPDQQIVGDAKYFTRVGGAGLPPAKFSIIAEYVWLLEKTGAPVTFLLFGNDRQVPLMWLERYGGLLTDTAFYFMTDDGMLEYLAGPDFLQNPLG